MTLKVPLGRTVITRNALDRLTSDDVQTVLAHHGFGDSGELCPEDWQENERSLRQGSRLLSVYRSKAGEKFWVITEADRSVTTVLLPDCSLP